MQKKRTTTTIEIILALTAFIIYLVWAIHLPSNMAPDENMRYALTKWIYAHNMLPKGDEKALIDKIWGYSYGFTPYLPAMFSVLFMKLTSAFTTGGKVLAVAARMVSVLAGTGTVVCCLAIGKEKFERKSTRYLFAILVGFLPQFVFLSAYCNNDSFAVLAVTMIFLAWLVGKRRSWDVKSCILLGVAISLCVLTYYNAYGYILCSVFIFIGEIWMDATIEKKIPYILKRGLLIAGIVLILTGWFFVRNAILYDGDFLGIDAMLACGEKYAQPSFKMSNHDTLEKDGYAFIQTFWTNGWIQNVIISFLGKFGYLSVKLHDIQYGIYILIIAVGVFLHGICLLRERRDIFLNLNLVLCIMIPLLLSMEHSYSIDFQPQGRYVISALPAMMYMVANGFEYGDERWKKRKKIGLTHIVMGIWSLTFFYTLIGIIIPKCMGA